MKHFLYLGTATLIIFLSFYAVINTSCEKRVVNVKHLEPDTTSHEIVWENYFFTSPYGTPWLHDVVIIDENNIWVVGEIYKDSINPHIPYNALYWNGEKWIKRMINFYICPVETVSIIVPIRTLFAFNRNKILFTRGASMVYWNGSTYTHSCKINPYINGSVIKMWGTDLNSIYAVGYGGTIVYYNGVAWHKIDANTDLTIYDIYGAMNEYTNENEILCVASAGHNGLGKKLIKLDLLKTTSLPDLGIYPMIESIWFVPGKVYYVGGAGIYTKKNIYDNAPWQRLNVTKYYTHAIRGNNENDVFAICAFGEVVHYNGSTWRRYFPAGEGDILYTGLDVKDNLIVIAGYFYNNAIIIIGKRIPKRR